MNTIRVGVIGTGHIGTEHVSRLCDLIQGAAVTAVTDVSKEACLRVLAARPSIRFCPSAQDLIESSDVDAVLIACSNAMHAPYAMAAVRAGKPVFCEKPLGVNAREIGELMAAETQAGRRLISVGFMRRFDKGYQDMKKVIRGGEMGEALIAYCAHRNPGDWIGRLKMTDAQAVVGTAIHEIDVMSWLFDDPFVSAQALMGRSTAIAARDGGYHDPVILNLKTRAGILVMLEINMACQYGYDIQCQVVFEKGVAKMPEPAAVTRRFGRALSSDLPSSWKTRFCAAFDAEIQAWIDSLRTGEDKNVANAWDAYRAALMTDACIAAEKTGQPASCGLPECPEFYR